MDVRPRSTAERTLNSASTPKKELTTDGTSFLGATRISRLHSTKKRFEADHQVPLGTTGKASDIGRRYVSPFPKASIGGRAIEVV